MPRLYRPAIPVEVKCRVLLRQLGEMFPEDVLATAKKARALGRLQNGLAKALSETLGCEASDLRLDHDPALGLRQRRGEGKKTVYSPAANDPEFLAYRPHGTAFAGSHDVKTRIRGDNGQFSDITLIKRERRRQKKAADAKNLKKNPSKWRTGSKFARSKQKIRSSKTAWPKRAFPKPAPRRKP